MKTLLRLFFTILLFPGPITVCFGQDDNSSIQFGAFIDTYYGYDFNQPVDRNRRYTTQASRHNEPNLNLAHFDAKLEKPNIHARIALQAGNSVQVNYATEPELARHIQEVYLGYRILDQTWLDGGIFLSHIGAESFISKDNLTYTRSLVADFSPYYQTGLRLIHHFSSHLKGQILLLNGWQRIKDNNDQKALGTQISYQPNDRLQFIYNTYLGQEVGFRHFHDLIINYSPADDWQFALQADLGFQTVNSANATSNWNGFSVMAKHRLTQVFYVNARIEQFYDPKQVLIEKINNNPFSAWGSSIGTEVSIQSFLTWRNELRSLFAKKPIFESNSNFLKSNWLAVTALSFSY